MASKSKSRSDYICRVRFRNTLPPIPFAPKMLTIPSLIDRHNSYQSNSLIEQTPHSFTMDQSSSISFDKAFIDNLDILENNAEHATMVSIAEEDKVLLCEPNNGDAGAGSASRRPNVTWLRRSEYIAHEARVIKSRKEGVENKFARSGESARKRNYDSIEDQVAGIENTFRPVPQDFRHPQTKSRAKKITPLLPDMACWENIYTIGQFSAEPADESRKAKRKAVSQLPGQPRPSALDGTDRGILRPMVNPHDSSDTYLVWFLPNNESTSRLVQQKEDSTLNLSGERLTYNAVCDYEYNNDAGAGSKYLLLSNHDDGEGEAVVYCPIRSKMNVRKKRALSAKLKYLDDYEKPNVLTVTYK